MVIIGCACNRQPVSQAEATPAKPPGRQAIQRAALRAPEWQLRVCSNDPAVQDWAERFAAAQPRGKTVRLVECAGGHHALPTLVIGDRLPEDLHGALKPVLDELAADGANRLALVNARNPFTASDSLPSTVSVYVDRQADRLIDDLTHRAETGWFSLFGGAWAYEVQDQSGTRLGSFYEGKWTYNRAEEIYLPTPGEPVAHYDSVAMYAVDSSYGTAILDTLYAGLREDSGALRGITEVYLYGSVEQIGLRRGNMSPRQRDGKELHLALDSWHVATPRPPRPLPDFLAGMTFAHEGYRVFNGYGGRTVTPAMDSLAALHINAVAIVPYTYMPAANRVGDLPVPTDAGSENDAAVVYAIRQATQRDWAVLLKPQIWVGGAWPGDVDFTDEADWEEFFSKYRTWMLHYARMAEAEGVAALCIGTELVQATLKHPDRWRQLIVDIRKVYGGKLTYAANWGEEFEHLTFWDQLDAVGLNSYYPLAPTESVTDEKLLAGARRWMDLADSISRRVDRPLWLTEVGYRSVAGAWMNPHAAAGDRAASERDQLRCYRALTVAAAESDRLRGMFIWKWPSYLGYSDDRYSDEDRGFTPGGKPAGQLLTDFYRRVGRQPR